MAQDDLFRELCKLSTLVDFITETHDQPRPRRPANSQSRCPPKPAQPSDQVPDESIDVRERESDFVQLVDDAMEGPGGTMTPRGAAAGEFPPGSSAG